MTILINGQQVEAIRRHFTAKEEPWIEYELDNGAKMRVKLIVAEVFQTNLKNITGQTMYSINAQTIFAVEEASEMQTNGKVM